MLEIEKLHSYYGDAHVLQGVSLNVGPGEIVALLGRNGMGKTTTIRSIMNLRQPIVREGEIRYRGERLNGMAPHAIARRKIALVPQGRRLFASLTVTEHMTMLKPASTKTGWTIARVFEAFPRLAERKNHRGSQLSGGERQMLAVARALMAEPRLLMLDEPSLGLAPVVVDQIFATLADLRAAGLTLLLVEQNVQQALELADRAYVLESGRLVRAGAAAALLADPAIRQHLLGL
jgi:branched-chain amino acid transport system ATP-binding protein